ncbi:MAG TPA: photosynthetic complex putative assembly protein PuhB [Sandaracinaceae bacterium LLY-WYZ-13_1]|nr:photosynthetic complex putative assembly protein PuhB [Sandaracinaceae bacterium LLY-WYZ-13_1]
MSTNELDLEHEPIPGLPKLLPPGETIVWQGRPRWRSLARHVFKTRWLALYFAVLLAVRASMIVANGEGVDGALSLLTMTGVFGAGMGLVALMAWLQARATIYTITTRRVVLRIGVTLSVAWNLPFKRLAAADLSPRPDGTGDIVLGLAPGEKIGWLYLWPHVEPGRLLRGSPALRSLADPQAVAGHLRTAVAQWAAEERVEVETQPTDGETSSSDGARPTPEGALGGLAMEAGR